jgi:hypothetical protein
MQIVLFALNFVTKIKKNGADRRQHHRTGGTRPRRCSMRLHSKTATTALAPCMPIVLARKRETSQPLDCRGKKSLPDLVPALIWPAILDRLARRTATPGSRCGFRRLWIEKNSKYYCCIVVVLKLFFRDW